MVNLKFKAIVFHNGHMVIENAAIENDLKEFWVELGPSVGWGRFERNDEWIKSGEAPFVLREVRPTHEKAPSPIASSLGVLWRRRAAIEAQQQIEAYQQSLRTP
ncbi:hypothetical protein GCT13_13410 [Paraburkholderia sp. CNPSo 3157]|uniref:Uncharacterized protein n=1 Tax=Paraburkholderia franconis TaxID=2654983 RepID=A0A7X1TG16_9BURK|nr:hypothetical protein [Paraburkholderia franconis]MPW17908.1 hypothetical protein [Paraburkholderia franconis]